VEEEEEVCVQYASTNEPEPAVMAVETSIPTNVGGHTLGDVCREHERWKCFAKVVDCVLGVERSWV